jgi:hypothetical protein
MIFLIYAGESIDKHPFMREAMNKLGMRESYVNIIKAVYEKCTANIILDRDELKTFPLRTKQGCPFSVPLFNCPIKNGQEI